MQHGCNSLELLQGNVHLAHRNNPVATKGDGNARTLNIKGPTKGHSNGNDNHIRKRKLQVY